MFGSKITDMVHGLLKEYINEGDIVFDATAGNGYDTVFLAENVGEKGKVYSFDVQNVAIDKTKEKLLKHNFSDRVELILDGHENIDKYIKDEISVGMFNLGYLPSGDKSIITSGDNTIKALNKSLEILKKGGVISLVIYYGHAGGLDEKVMLGNYLEGLNSNTYHVLTITHTNRVNNAPIISFIYKKT